MWRKCIETKNFLGAIFGQFTKSFHMVVADALNNNSCEVYTFKDNSWSPLPDLKSQSYNFRRLIAIDGVLIAGGFTSLETLDLSTPDLIFKLVHFVVELDLFDSSSKKTSCKHLLTSSNGCDHKERTMKSPKRKC